MHHYASSNIITKLFYCRDINAFMTVAAPTSYKAAVSI